jgi:16S rRNA G1207 methylase RsmC
MTRNDCTTDNMLIQSSLQLFPHNVKIILIKIPKTLAYLEFLLQQLSTVISPDTLVIAAAKVKMIHKSTLALFEQYIGTTKIVH